MPINFDGECLVLDSVCAVEEALPLLEALQAKPDRGVDMARATHVHSAILQVLMAAKADIVSLPEEPFLRRVIEPLERSRV